MTKESQKMNEREAVKNMVANLVIAVLWDPSTREAEGDTGEHHIRVWKENAVRVMAEIRKVR